MALPKKQNKTDNSYLNKELSERREELFNYITDNDNYLPKGVLHEDMDTTFKKYVKDNLTFTHKGKDLPVLLMGIHGWNEYTKTWKLTDKYENIKIPFILIVRQPNDKIGSNPIKSNVPNGYTFHYHKVPKYDGNKKTFDIYKIPQPIVLDITYKVYIITYKQSQLNTFNKNVVKEFQSLQSYINTNGHYMPLFLEDVGDESKISNIEEKRFYMLPYTFRLEGFILDPEDFVMVRTIDQINIVPNI